MDEKVHRRLVVSGGASAVFLAAGRALSPASGARARWAVSEGGEA